MTPLGRFRGYCVALGDGGVVYGLGVYLGDRGLLNYLATMTSEDEPDGVEAWNGVWRCPRFWGTAKNWATGNGGPCASWASGTGAGADGRCSAASFRGTGLVLSGDEARFLTVALDSVRDVAERIGQGTLDLYAGRDPGEVLTRSLRGGVWRDQWEPLRPPALPAEEHRADGDRVQSIGRSKPAGSAVWEVTASYIPTGVQDERGTRPYLPTLVIVVEAESGLILTVRMLGRVPSSSERQEPVLELLEEVDRLPGAVVCDREDTAALLVPITRALDIGLYVGPTPALDAIKDDLLATVLR